MYHSQKYVYTISTTNLLLFLILINKLCIDVVYAEVLYLSEIAQSTVPVHYFCFILLLFFMLLTELDWFSACAQCFL